MVRLLFLGRLLPVTGKFAILELMTVVDLFNGLNKLMAGLQVVTDEKSWYG